MDKSYLFSCFSNFFKINVLQAIRHSNAQTWASEGASQRVCNIKYCPCFFKGFKQKTIFKIPGDHSVGFTLIEVVATLLVLGILAAIAIPRFTTSNTSATVDAHNLKSCLRKTQTKSLSDAYLATAGDSNWSLEISGNSAIIKKAGVQKDICNFKSSFISGGPIYFDNRGRPVNSNGQPLTTSASFSIPGYNHSITVIPVTGFVE